MRLLPAVVVTACAALAFVQPGAAGPGDMAALAHRPNVVRLEVVVVEGGVVHDYRIDRGRVRAVGAGSLTLLERDGSVVTVPLAASVEVRVGKRFARPAMLRRSVGALATTVRDGDRPATFVQVGR